MTMYNKSDLDDIRAKVDIVEFLEQKYSTSFRFSGGNYVALCPVHKENSPSFSVRPEHKTFYCFGCGIKGDIFSLVQELEALSFPGSVQYLAEVAGVQLKIDEDPAYVHRQRLQKMLRTASEWLHELYRRLPDEHVAKQNLANRDLLAYSMNDESVGYYPARGLLEMLGKHGYKHQDFVDVGFLKKSSKSDSYYEIFRNRLIWTIYDAQSRPVGFSARKLVDEDTGPKYINTPETLLFKKSKTLLGLNTAKKSITQQQSVFIVEGQTDVMALKAAGNLNTVASCGTAFGGDHVSLLLNLSKLGKDSDSFSLVFCFDGDEAGLKAARRVFQNNKSLQSQSYVVEFVKDDNSPTDPDEYRKLYGSEALNRMIVENKISIVEFILKKDMLGYDITNPESASAFISKAKETLTLITDPIQYAAYIRRISHWTGINIATLENVLRVRSQPRRNNQGTPVNPFSVYNVPQVARPSEQPAKPINSLQPNSPISSVNDKSHYDDIPDSAGEYTEEEFGHERDFDENFFVSEEEAVGSNQTVLAGEDEDLPDNFYPDEPSYDDNEGYHTSVGAEQSEDTWVEVVEEISSDTGLNSVAPQVDMNYAERSEVEYRVLACLAQHPNITTSILEQHNFNISYIQNNEQFAKDMLTYYAQYKSYDLSNPQIVELLHYPLHLLEGREEQGVRSIVHSFYHFLKRVENEKIEQRFLTNPDNLDMLELLTQKINAEKETQNKYVTH